MTDDECDADDAPFVEFYTRSGCPISSSLLRKLRRSGVRLRLHDIWADEGDAAFVRSVARGSETVPTVVVGSRAFVAPSARTVLRAIAEHDPTLVHTPLPHEEGHRRTPWLRWR